LKACYEPPRRGDFATAGEILISLTDANSFWVDGYFEETGMGPIQVGDPAEVRLMGYRKSSSVTSRASRERSTTPMLSPMGKALLR
jgi:multidrug resistance efflux pump